MVFDAQEIAAVAALAQLELTAEETSFLAEQLQRVTAFLAELQTFAVADPELSVDELGLAPEVADVPAAGLPQALFLANAPASEGGFLVVPAVKPLTAEAAPA